MIQIYHAPEFSSNVLATQILSECFEILYIATSGPQNSCLIVELGNLNDENTILEIICENECIR